MNKELKWDLYFLRLAKQVSTNSSCMSRKIGAVLVKDKAIISTGYNGPVRGVKHCNERVLEFYESFENKRLYELEKDYPITICPRKFFGYKSGQGLHLCQAAHAEENSLIQAARNGISTYGTALYCYCGQICKNCAIKVINAGVKELIYLDGKEEYDKYAGVLLEESGIVVRKINESLI